MKEHFRFPRFLSYAIGRFAHNHRDAWFEGVETPNPFGSKDRLRASIDSLACLSELYSSDDRIFHDHYHPREADVRLESNECKYCHALLSHEFVQLSDDGITHNVPIPLASFSELSNRSGLVIICTNCGWWKLIKHFKDGVCSDEDHSLWFTNFIYEGIIHTFPQDSPEGLIEAVRQQIARREIDLYSISPTMLEHLVGAVVKDHLGLDVRHVGGPGDEGIDLLVSESANPIAIQVKRRQSHSKIETVSEVRHLLGSMLIKGYKHGILATTAGRFSRPAQAAVEGIRERLSVVIELYDYRKLLELVQPNAITSRPWDLLLTSQPPRPVASATVSEPPKRGTSSLFRRWIGKRFF